MLLKYRGSFINRFPVNALSGIDILVLRWVMLTSEKISEAVDE